MRYINDSAFEGCSALSDLTLIDGVEDIDTQAFFDCTSLKKVFLPESAEYLRSDCFGYYNDNETETKLSGFTIYGIDGSKASSYASEHGFDFVPVSADTGDCEYSYNDSSKTLTISGNGAMADYNSTDYLSPWDSYSMRIEKIVVKEGVTRIGNFAFLLCAGVKSFAAPSTLKSIGISAFAFCTDLRSADLKNVTSVEDCAFGFCGAMTAVKFRKVKKLAPSAFTYTSLKNVTLPASCTSAIGAFALTTSLKKLKVLNKKCALEGKVNDYTYGKEAIPEKTVITGYKDSTAHKYAKKYSRKINFIKEANPMKVSYKKSVNAKAKIRRL